MVIQYNIPTLTRLWSCKICTCHSANTSAVHSSDINVVAGGTLQSRYNNSVVSHIKLRGESWWTGYCSIVVLDIRTTSFITIECNASSICSIRCVTCYIERSELTSLWRICKEISKRKLEYVMRELTGNPSSANFMLHACVTQLLSYFCRPIVKAGPSKPHIYQNIIIAYMWGNNYVSTWLCIFIVHPCLSDPCSWELYYSWPVIVFCIFKLIPNYWQLLPCSNDVSSYRNQPQELLAND